MYHTLDGGLCVRRIYLFDLTLFPLNIEAGREQDELPGLLIIPAPRKTARMRSQDTLILMMRLFTPTGEPVDLTTSQQQEMLQRLAETYFKTPGSVTAGLRAVVTRLNDFLLSRNLRAGQDGQRIGSLNLAVLHGSMLFLAHGGPTHSFFMDKSHAQHFDDGQGLRGLGLSRQAVPRFYQTELASNDILILCPDPPVSWSRGLGSAQNLTLEHLRRRIIGEAGVQLKAAVVRFANGKGQINTWRPSAAARRSLTQQPEKQANPESTSLTGSPVQTEQTPPPIEKVAEDSAKLDVPVSEKAVQEGDQTEQQPTIEVEAAFEHEVQASGQDDQVVFLGDEAIEPKDEIPPPQPRPRVREWAADHLSTTVQNTQREGEIDQARGIRLSPAVDRPVNTRANVEPAERLPKTKMDDVSAQRTARPAGPSPGEVLRHTLKPVWIKVGAIISSMSGALSKVLAKLFPKRTEPLINLSPSVMLMIAIIVPVLMGTLGAVVYFRLGRTEQFNNLFLQAQQYAFQASQFSEPEQQREGWKRVLEVVDEAEKYGSSEESTALALQAQDALDQLEGYVRLDFRPAASGSLDQTVNITRILAKLNQVYLLDASEGRILSLTRITTGGYEINAFFNCGAGRAGGAYIGPLIDLAELPVNNDLNAEVVGIDAGGNLVYCSSNRTGFDSRPLVIPDIGWGEIAGITTYNDILYVLDPKSNAVYWYSGERGNYTDSPHLYFDEDIPYMADVIDLAVDQEFLYMLHADGRMTVCSSGGVTYATTRCTDPAPYGDNRPGFEPSPLVFSGTSFTHLQTTEPPDPSLFVLDSLNASIYHLSQRRMNLQRQYRPFIDSDYLLPKRTPTAFAITPNRRALLAFGHQVFVAPLP